MVAMEIKQTKKHHCEKCFFKESVTSHDVAALIRVSGAEGHVEVDLSLILKSV